ncbi:MAG TPA: hypothetical protein VGB89_14110 [Bacteroidota bacterium]
MTTGQTMLTIFAMMMVTTILMNYYRLMAATGDDIASAQDGILATTIATSYMELANGLAFDAYTDTGHVGSSQKSLLTLATNLGRESSYEDSVHKFDDYDDFNGFSIEREAGGTGRRFRTLFTVFYVQPNNVSAYSGNREFVKRMDLKIWRTFPRPEANSRLDTLKVSQVRGYYHFD